jgi:predicted AAA+ superfamily ATPase
MKYYAEDVGLRNARLGFREQEETHLMENIIFNELVRLGCSVDVGVVDVWDEDGGKKMVRHHEIDFVVNTGREKVYIQSALNVDTEAKKQQETFSLKNSGDFFRKIVITDGNAKPWVDDDGIMYVGIIPFLLEEDL